MIKILSPASLTTNRNEGGSMLQWLAYLLPDQGSSHTALKISLEKFSDARVLIDCTLYKCN